MKTEAVFVTNFDQLEKCESMNIPWKAETDYFPFLFDINDAKAAYIDAKGDIIVYLEVITEDTQWRMKFDKELWKQLEEKFK